MSLCFSVSLSLCQGDINAREGGGVRLLGGLGAVSGPMRGKAMPKQLAQGRARSAQGPHKDCARSPLGAFLGGALRALLDPLGVDQTCAQGLRTRNARHDAQGRARSRARSCARSPGKPQECFSITYSICIYIYICVWVRHRSTGCQKSTESVLQHVADICQLYAKHVTTTYPKYVWMVYKLLLVFRGRLQWCSLDGLDLLFEQLPVYLPGGLSVPNLNS